MDNLLQNMEAKLRQLVYYYNIVQKYDIVPKNYTYDDFVEIKKKDLLNLKKKISSYNRGISNYNNIIKKKSTCNILFIGADKMLDITKLNNICPGKFKNIYLLNLSDDDLDSDILESQKNKDIYDTWQNYKIVDIYHYNMNDLKIYDNIKNDFFDIVLFDWSTVKFAEFTLRHIFYISNKLAKNGTMYIQRSSIGYNLTVPDYIYNKHKNPGSYQEISQDTIKFELLSNSLEDILTVAKKDYFFKNGNDYSVLGLTVVLGKYWITFRPLLDNNLSAMIDKTNDSLKNLYNEYNMLLFSLLFENCEYVLGSYLFDNMLDTSMENGYYKLWNKKVNNSVLNYHISVDEFNSIGSAINYLKSIIKIMNNENS